MIEIVETTAWIVGLIVLVAIVGLLVALNEADRPYRPHRSSSPDAEQKEGPTNG